MDLAINTGSCHGPMYTNGMLNVDNLPINGNHMHPFVYLLSAENSSNSTVPQCAIALLFFITHILVCVVLCTHDYHCETVKKNL